MKQRLWSLVGMTVLVAGLVAIGKVQAMRQARGRRTSLEDPEKLFRNGTV